jgi:hypothetical protein
MHLGLEFLEFSEQNNFLDNPKGCPLAVVPVFIQLGSSSVAFDK